MEIHVYVYTSTFTYILTNPLGGIYYVSPMETYSLSLRSLPTLCFTSLLIPPNKYMTTSLSNILKKSYFSFSEVLARQLFPRQGRVGVTQIL